MYRIIKVTNNNNDRVYYNVEVLKRHLLFWERWEIGAFHHGWGLESPRDFDDILTALYWIRRDMLAKKFKETRTSVLTFNNLDEVNHAIEMIEVSEELERQQVNLTKDPNFYNNQDESTNRETEA